MSGPQSLALGLIGCGTMGGSHATQLVSLADAHLAIACDLDITKAEAVVASKMAAFSATRSRQ